MQLIAESGVMVALGEPRRCLSAVSVSYVNDCSKLLEKELGGFRTIFEESTDRCGR